MQLQMHSILTAVRADVHIGMCSSSSVFSRLTSNGCWCHSITHSCTVSQLSIHSLLQLVPEVFTPVDRKAIAIGRNTATQCQ